MFRTKYSVSIYLGMLLGLVLVGSLLSAGKGELRAAPKESVEETIKKAESLNSGEKYEASLELLLGAVNDQPSNSVLKALLKKTFVFHLQSKIAEGYAKIEADKHDPEGYLTVSNAYNMVDDRFRSMEVLTAGIIENPRAVRLWLAIGLLELEQKRDAEALSVFNEIIKIDSKNAHAYNDLAFVQSRTEDQRLLNLGAALKNAEKAVSLEPNNANFIDTLAEIDFRRGEKQSAIKLIKRAIELDPEEPFYQSQLDRFENESPEQVSRDMPGLAK